MGVVQLDAAIPRFRDNEARVDKFVNGGINESYVTSDGAEVPTLRKFLADKNTEFNGNGVTILSQSNAAKTAAQQAAAAAATSAQQAALYDPTQMQRISDRGLLSGMRNKIINGDFEFWRRGVAQSGTGVASDDRWNNNHVGVTKTHTRIGFSNGQNLVPGNPKYWSRTEVVNVNGASNFCNKSQCIEDVRTSSGRKITATFWAYADAAKNMAIEFTQNFGTGGSAEVAGLGQQLIALTTGWKKYSVTVDLPSIAGKIIGPNGDDYLGMIFWFNAGTSFAYRSAQVGQQSGQFNISRVSVVEGDSRLEDDPSSPRGTALEEMLCQRFYAQWPGVAYTSTLARTSYVATGVFTWAFPVPMRIEPTVGWGSLTNGTFNSQGVSRFGAQLVGNANSASSMYFNNLIADAEF